MSSTVQSFVNEWSRLHKGRQPIGWVLRQDSALPWVRFHSLPASKRYAETAAEMDIILSRGNALASEIFKETHKCWVICSSRDDIVGGGELAGSWIDDIDDPFAWKFFVREGKWSAGKYDRYLKEIADDGPYYVVWFDPERGTIFAPYDGGFDLFLSSQQEVTFLKSRYAEWLSNDSSGL